MRRYTQAEIAMKVRRWSTWYHNIVLDGVPTNPSRPDYPESRWRLLEPYVPPSLTDKTVLDLGCNAGYFAIKFRERGASVLGVDWFPEAIEQAKFVAEVLDLDIEYRLQNVYEFVLQCDQAFDYVLFLGTFYHTRYPLLILDRLPAITKEKMFFQTVVAGPEPGPDLVVPPDLVDYEAFKQPGFPAMYFIENKLHGAYNNWFVCNSAAVVAMLRSAGFHNIERSGRDCFVCEPAADLNTRWRVAHDLAAIRVDRPPQDSVPKGS